MVNQFSDETDGRGQRITYGIFIIIIGFFAVAFRFVPIPSREGVDESLDILMLEVYAMEAEVEEETEAEVEEETEVVERDAETSDVSELLAAFGDLSLSKVTSEDVTASDSDESQTSGLRPDINMDLSTGFDALGSFGDGRPSDLNADLLPQSGGGEERWTLKPSLVSSSVPGNQVGFQTRNQSGVSDVDALAVRQQEPDDLFEAIIERKDPVDMTIEDVKREDDVAKWFVANASPLDPGIRALFNQTPGVFTAKDSVNIGAQMYVVQLMYSPHSRKLHIALSSEKEVHYFIDPKLQNIFNYYEEGVVVRDEAVRVIIVESEELPVNTPGAVQEYKNFLSWWVNEVNPNG